MPETLRGTLVASHARVGIVRSRFNPEITERLLAGALDALREAEVPDDQIMSVEVPGAVEIPLAADALARRGDLAAIVTLGAVIRGETPHFDIVCKAAVEGCLRVSLDHRIPIGFGVITVEDEDQALARALPGETNKGYEAAVCAIEMATLLGRIGS